MANHADTVLPMINSDIRQRFVFDEIDARGCIVRLSETCESIQATHHYPANLASLLNQFALAATLLRDSIKIDGSLTIQLRTDGPIKFIMADCMSDRRVRAISEYDSEELPANDQIALDGLGDRATLAITISPDQGERYQSIVPIEHASLGECLEDYFQRSEQLPSLFRLLADQQQAVGISIHALPQDKVNDKIAADEHFTRIKSLLNTLNAEEAFSLSAEQTLTRLFHDESCRLFESEAMQFGCICSAEKSLGAIKSLGKDDIQKLINEQQEQGKPSLVVDCHFCFQRYEFSFEQVNGLFA
ncbi:MAG: molecular chaperone Hsp33 [Arenicella sp.]|jgi:molecular chaperone Hsp33